MSRTTSSAEPTAAVSDDDRPDAAGLAPRRSRNVGARRGRRRRAVLVSLELLTRAELVTPRLPAAGVVDPARDGRAAHRAGSSSATLWVTLQACLIGLAIAALVAVPLGLVLGLTDIAHKATVAVIEFLRPIPSVALIPLAILIYGRGTEMKVALVVFACVWPMLFNTIYGIRRVDPVAADTARVFGLGRWQIGGPCLPAQRVAVHVHRASRSPRRSP